jgi:hypothetical protein
MPTLSLPVSDSLGDEIHPELVTALPVERPSAAGRGEPAVAETLVSCVSAPSRMRSFARAAVPRAMNESTAGAQPGPMAGKTGPWRTVLSRG